MKKQLGRKPGSTIALTLCLLSSTVAMANDAVLGALLGGGAGAVVGHSIGGRDGTVIGGALGAAAGAVIGSERGHGRVDYSVAPVHYTQPGYYAPPVAYYPQQQIYYSQPVRVEQRPIYYIQDSYDRGYRRHHDRRDWGDRNDHRRGRGDRDWDGRR
jgi:hypothetical protein